MRRQVLFVAVVMALIALVAPRGAWAQHPPCRTGCGGAPPWVELAAPSGSPIYTPTPYTEIHFCKNAVVLDPSAFQIKLNGVDETSSFSISSGDPGGLCGGSPSVDYTATSNTVTWSVGSDTLYAKVCDDNGLCGDQSWYFTLVAPGSPIATLKNQNGDNIDRGLCLTMGAGQAAGLSCGDLFVTHGMPTYRTLGRDRSLSLFYSSASATPRPVVAVDVTEGDTVQSPLIVVATLLVNGTVKDSVRYRGFSPGVHQVVVGFDASAYASGIYGFSVLVRNQYKAAAYTDTLTGELLVVNRSSSPFGSGWWLEGVEQLVTGQSSNRILLIDGDGSAAVYDSLNSTTWVRASGPFLDTLARSGGQYTRSLRHGIKVTFDSSGNHIQTANKAHPGQVTTFIWTGSPARLIKIAVPPTTVSDTFRLVWNGSTNLLDSIIDPPGRSLRASMSSGNLVRLRDPDTDSVMFGYDGSHRLTSRTNERSKATAYVYANGLHVTRVAIPMVPSSSDSARDSSRTRFEWWDEKGLGMGYPSDTLTSVDTSTAYSKVYGPRVNTADDAAFWVDRWGAPVRVAGAVGDTTILTRSTTTGLVSMVRNPVGDSITATYTTRGNDSTVTDQTHEGASAGASTTAVTTSYAYGDSYVPDSPTSIKTPVDTTTIAYNDSLGLPALITRQGGAKTSFSFDLTKGLLTSTTDSAVRVVDTLTSHIFSRTLANLTTSFAYDSAGNDSATTMPSGRTSYVVRDTYHRVIHQYDAALHRTDHAYNLNNRDTAVTVWDGSNSFTTYYYYSRTGAIDSILDPRSVPRSWRYDEADRDTAMFAEDSSSEWRRYNPAGQLDSIHTRAGDVIGFRYDSGNRLQATWYGSHANTFSPGLSGVDSTLPGDSTVRTYDAAGRLLSAQRNEHKLTRIYNREGTLRSEEQTGMTAWGGSQTYDVTVRNWYDGGDRRTKFYNGSDSLFYSYGTNALLSKIAVQWASATSQPRDSFLLYWDALGRRDSLIYGRPNIHVSFGYDVDGRQRMVCSRHPGTSNHDDEFLHQYIVTQENADGMPLAWHESYGSNGAESDTACVAQLYHSVALDTLLQYDARHQLNQDGSQSGSSYTYDASGNRMARHALFDGSLTDSLVYDSHHNRLHYSYGSTGGLAKTYHYDANGSMHYEEPAFGTDNRRLYYYNAVGETRGNRLAQSGIWTGGPAICVYDAVGRRISPCGSGAGQEVYDGNNEVVNNVWRYVHGPGLDDPLEGLAYSGSGSIYHRYYYITDGTGRQLVFADTTAADQAGNSIYTNGGGNQAGGITASTGFENGRAVSASAPQLSYYRNRYFDQQTGRWTQEDPIGVGGGLNLYSYAGNNPVAYADPFGLCPICALAVNAGLGAFIGGSVQAFQNIRNGRDWREGVGHAMLGGAAVGAVGYAAGAIVSAVDGGAVATGTRYMGEAEAAEVDATGSIPSVNAAGRPRNIHYTSDAPTSSAAEAQARYNLPSKPTHRSSFPLSGVHDNVQPEGTVAPGATQAATSRPINGAGRPVPLDP